MPGAGLHHILAAPDKVLLFETAFPALREMCVLDYLNTCSLLLAPFPRDVSKQNLAERMDASKLKTQPKLYWFHWRVEQMRLGMKARREISEAHYRRYQRAGKKDKGNILDEVTGTTGLNRDHPTHGQYNAGPAPQGVAE
jgi:hypothetical protein